MHIDLAPVLALTRPIRPRRTVPVIRDRGPWRRLVTEMLRLAGPDAEFLHHAERPWWSATFSGARHTVRLAFDGHEAISGGEALIATMPDHEFTIRGQLVADATITSVEHQTIPHPRMVVEAELLLLEEA